MRRVDEAGRPAANRMLQTLAPFPVERAGDVVELEADVLPLEYSGMRALTIDDELVAEVRALVMIEVGAERQRLPPPDGICPAVGGDTEMTR